MLTSSPMSTLVPRLGAGGSRAVGHVLATPAGELCSSPCDLCKGSLAWWRTLVTQVLTVETEAGGSPGLTGCTPQPVSERPLQRRNCGKVGPTKEQKADSWPPHTHMHMHLRVKYDASQWPSSASLCTLSCNPIPPTLSCKFLSRS